MPVIVRAYLLLATIALTAMATRVGWINWPQIGTATALLIVGLLVFIIVLTLVIGAFIWLLISLADWLFKPAPVALEAGASTGASERSAPGAPASRAVMTIAEPGAE